MSETRKRRTPGISEHIKSINAIKDELNKIQDSINEYRQKIQDEYTITRNATQHNNLLSEKDTIISEIKDIRSMREHKINLRNSIQNDIKGIREDLKTQKRNLNISDPIAIAKKRADIENKMITEKLTAQKEKEYRNQLLDMRIKSSSFGDFQEREEKLVELEMLLNDVKEELKELNKCMDLRKGEIDELKEHLDKIKEKGKIKSPVVLEYESKISALKKRKDDLLDKKKIEHEEIKKKEELYEQHMAEIEEAISIENERKNQRIKISKLNEELAKLEDEKNNVDPNKYDVIIDIIKNIKDPKTLNIRIVQILGEFKINLPKNNEEILKAIDILESKKIEFRSQVGNKLNEISEKIKKIQNQIKDEKKKLDEMPNSDFKLKGLNLNELGFRNDSRKRGGEKDFKKNYNNNSKYEKSSKNGDNEYKKENHWGKKEEKNLNSEKKFIKQETKSEVNNSNWTQKEKKGWDL